MKRLFIMLFATCLISSTFAQQASPPSRELQNSASFRQKLGVDIPVTPAPENQFLFFQLPASRSVEGARKIDFIAHVTIYQFVTIEHRVICREDGSSYTQDVVTGSEYEYFVEDNDTGQPC